MDKFMESFEVKINNGNLEILGIPDAHAAFKLKNNIAKNLTDLTLHRYDLKIAKESLNFIESQKLFLSHTIIDSLWRSAIIHYIKCFTNQITERVGKNRVVPSHARIKLDKKLIYVDPLAFEAFETFYQLRNKHIVHDENSYLQSTPGFVINSGEKNYKVEKVFCVTTANETVEGNFNNLYLLVKEAVDFVEKEFTRECNKITNILEEFNYEELTKFGSVEFKIADLENIKQARKLD